MIVRDVMRKLIELNPDAIVEIVIDKETRSSNFFITKETSPLNEKQTDDKVSIYLISDEKYDEDCCCSGQMD